MGGVGQGGLFSRSTSGVAASISAAGQVIAALLSQLIS